MTRVPVCAPDACSLQARILDVLAGLAPGERLARTALGELWVRPGQAPVHTAVLFIAPAVA